MSFFQKVKIVSSFPVRDISTYHHLSTYKTTTFGKPFRVAFRMGQCIQHKHFLLVGNDICPLMSEIKTYARDSAIAPQIEQHREFVARSCQSLSRGIGKTIPRSIIDNGMNVEVVALTLIKIASLLIQRMVIGLITIFVHLVP